MVLPVIRVEVDADTAQATDNIQDFKRELDSIPQSGRRASRSASSATGSFDRLGVSAALSSNRARQLTQQLSQVAQQSVATGQVAQAFAIQAADIGLAFGTVGTIVGALAGVALPTLISVFSDASDETRDYADIVSEAEDALRTYTEAVRLADISTNELGERFIEITPGVRAFSNALSDVAGRDVTARIQEAVEAVALFQRATGQGASATAGDVTGLAALFDVNIALAFTRQTIEARDRARELTEEFARTQLELEQTDGNLERQSELLRSLVQQATVLANETGGITQAENDLIRQIAQALSLVEGQLDTTRRAEAATVTLAQRFGEVQAAAAGVMAIVDGLEGPIRQAAGAAADLATNLFEAARARAEIIDSATRRGGGRGGDPRQFGLDDAAISLLTGFGGEFIDFGTGGGGGGGGTGGGGADRGRIEALVNSLQTERELVEQFRTEGLELLALANEEELAALGGFNEAKLRLEQEYQDRLLGIKKTGAAADLAVALGAGSDVLTALGSFNDKALKIARVFGAAQALIGAFQGAAEALKLPYPFNIAAAAQVLGTGLGFVSAIKGVSSGGSGGGSAAATGALAADPVQPGQNIVIDFQGDTFTKQGGIALIESINEALRDGGQIDGILAR